MKLQREPIDATTLHRIAILFRELSDVYEKLAMGLERRAEKAVKQSARRRARSPAHYVPTDEPSELDIARAKSVLKKMGCT